VRSEGARLRGGGKRREKTHGGEAEGAASGHGGTGGVGWTMAWRTRRRIMRARHARPPVAETATIALPLVAPTNGGAHSPRNTTAGFAPAARRAGSQLATSATATNTLATAT
jgi:hypothetical protein